MVSTEGRRIGSEEFKSHLLAHPKIESACAVAILREACALSSEVPLKFLQARDVASYKILEHLQLAEGFPITPAGKILRRDLMALVAERIA